ncbi:MAG: hypothetical protein OXI80_19470 [Caldilineaceae bacterium]|nr:hypothetical protein [Caldilineaceae bacterium]MDE0339862.1 hypothetical protein [Caldilineaceae bacterium]
MTARSDLVPITIKIHKDILPELQESHFTYTFRLLDEPYTEKESFPTISASPTGVVATSITPDERNELISLLRAVAHSLEHDVLR